MKFDNDVAASPMITLIAVFLLSAILFIIIGYGVDKIVMVSLKFASMPSSQLRYDTVRTMLLVFQFEPVLILIGAGLNSLIASIRVDNTETDLSSLLKASSELIVLTLALIALTMFGGTAIESVVSFVNTFSWGAGVQLELFAAVQYVAPVFYGLCFLGLVGAAIQFILTCVRVTDYVQQY